MKLKLPFGLKDGRLVEVTDVERGLKCYCICPHCKSKLVARKGDLKINHFAHYKNTECEYGFETALHLAAKEIIQKSRKIKLPGIHDKVYHHMIQEILPETVVKVDRVSLENKIGNIVPDIVIEIGGKKLLVEIAVTHFIDGEKQRKIEELDISTIEIDLSELENEKLNFAFLRNILINETQYKYWVHNAKRQELIMKKYHQLEAKEKIEKDKKIRREQFLLQNKKKIIIRPSTKSSFGEYWHIDHCPLRKNQYRMSDEITIPYANVHKDCHNCNHFRGYRDNKNSIVCLAEYYISKND